MMNKDRVSQKLDKAIEICSSLYLCLQEFELVVLKENEAIGRSDLAELEAITDEKLLYGDRTSKHIQRLLDLMVQLADEVGEISLRTQDDKQLTQFSVSLKLRVTKVFPELDSQLNQFSSWVQSLKDLRMKIFAQIETNAYLVQRLLDYHRDTYAFWQAVAQESESGYGKSGKTKYGQSGPSKSLLTVRT